MKHLVYSLIRLVGTIDRWARDRLTIAGWVVLTTAIVLETRQGQFDRAIALGVILLVISFVINLVVLGMQGRGTMVKS